MFGLAQGLRFTFRQLAKSPVFTAVSIVTIALGIGANTAIFSVMNAVILQTLPTPNPQQLVYFHLKNQPLNTSQTGYGDMSMSMPVFEAMRTRKEVFEDVIGFAPLGFEKVAVRVGREPEEVLGEMVSGNFFSGLGVQPVLGRGFTPQDESMHAPIAVLNYAWWKNRFGGDKDILGKTIYVKGVPITIVGVAPRGFNGVNPLHPSMDFWIPLQNRPELNAWGTPPTDHTLYGSPNWLALDMLGRLEPGISPEQAAAQLTPAFRTTLAGASPVDPRDQKPVLVLSNVRGVEDLLDDYEHPLRFLMSMVVLVLLIACANVVMLVLARNAGRLPEFCLRQALGAKSSDLGMRTAGLLVFGVSPQSNIRSDADAIRFHTALLERMRALPGVDSATIMQVRIGSGTSNNDGILVDGRNPAPDHPFAGVRVNLVGSAFLHTLGIPLRQGRDIQASDAASSPKVAIVNQTFVERYLSGAEALGHHIAVEEDPKTEYTIVGVAGNSRYTGVREADRPMAYVPYTQVQGVLGMQYELHTTGDPKMLVKEAAKVVHDVDPNLPLEKPITQENQFAESIARDRLVANLSVFFAVLAAFLVAIGLYGTISYGVSRRTMAIGVRVALGAQRLEVLRMIFVESLSVAALGLALGVPASLAVARTLRSMVYGLSTNDPLTILSALAGIAAVTLAAAFFPARRAASIDPMRALRME